MIRKFSFALVALLALPLVASADFASSLDYTGLKNLVTFDTYHAVYNPQTGTVISPTAYNAGDMLLTLYTAKTLSIQSAPNSPIFNPTAWAPAAGDYVVAYSASTINALPILNNPSSDPAGLLTGSSMLGVWQSASNWTISGNVLADIAASIPGGHAVGTFGIVNGATDGASLQPLVPAFNPLLPALHQFYLTQTGGALPILANATNGTDVAGAGIIGTIGGVGGWFSGGSTSAQFALVPEPGTIALWGAGLAIGALVAFRRRKQS